MAHVKRKCIWRRKYHMGRIIRTANGFAPEQNHNCLDVFKANNKWCNSGTPTANGAKDTRKCLNLSGSSNYENMKEIVAEYMLLRTKQGTESTFQIRHNKVDVKMMV